MAERHSALAGVQASPAATGGTTLRELRPKTILQVAAWPDTLPAVRGVFADLLRIEAPKLGTSAGDAQTTIMSIGPGRYVVLADGENLPARIEAALPSAEGAVADLSHGRTALRLEGPNAASVLARCVAIDLHSRVFPPGRVAQTAIHHVDVTICRQGENVFDLVLLRGFAESLVEWLLDAGLEFGLAFKGSPG